MVLRTDPITKQCRRLDSNQRPRAYESLALPLSYVGEPPIVSRVSRGSNRKIEVDRGLPAGARGRAGTDEQGEPGSLGNVRASANPAVRLNKKTPPMAAD